MFEDALLESSPRQKTVLRRIHCLLSIFTGIVAFALGVELLPMFLLAGERALTIAAALGGGAIALYSLMLCYVWADAHQNRRWAWAWLGLTLALNLPGFLAYLIYSAWKTGDWKRAAILLAYVAESMVVGVMILVPLIHTQALTKDMLITVVHIPPPPGRPAARPAGPPPHIVSHHAAVDPRFAPPIIPTAVVIFKEAPEPPQAQEGVGDPSMIGVAGGVEFGNGTVLGSLPVATAPPPPTAPVRKPSNPTILKVSRGVIEAKALYQPKPPYPQLAMIARIQGMVELQAIIGKDGTIQNLEVLSGHPLLVRAALDAVRTWRYQPTLLNSEPVEVLTEIDVNFKLGD